MAIPEYELVIIASIVWLGYLGSCLFRRINLPTVTGFLLVGILLGPQISNIISQDLLRQLKFFDPFALSIIAFVVGEQLYFHQVKSFTRRILLISLFETSLTAVFTFIAVLYISHSRPLALLLSIIAMATAPATFAAVKDQMRAKGEMTTTVSAAVAINNVACIALFSLFLPLVIWSYEPSSPFNPALISASKNLLASFFLGLGVVFFLNVFLSSVETSGELLVYVLSHLAIVVAASTLLKISPLLPSLIAGIVTVNFFGEETLRQRIFDALKPILEPIYLIFFVLAGASLRFDLLVASGSIVFAYILARTTGKIAGPFLGSLASGLPIERAGFFSLAFMSQSAVAIGLSLLAKDTYPALGSQINAIILGAVIIFELVGPYLLKSFFERTGESYLESANLLVAPAEELAVSKVVVPIGTKVPSKARIQVVTELTKKMKGNVVALHVQRKFTQEKRIPIRSSAEKALKRFRELAEAEGVEVNIRIEVSERVPETICQVAQEEAADLIIMGASGRSGLLARLTASISDKVAKKASCPVLVMVD